MQTPLRNIVFLPVLPCQKIIITDRMVKKKIGQNFLIDKQVAEREVNYASPNKEDTVLEIGPGKGILTKPLAKKVKKVVAIEIDSQLVKKLEPTLPDNVKLINTDALKIDFKTFVEVKEDFRLEKCIPGQDIQISAFVKTRPKYMSVMSRTDLGVDKYAANGKLVFKRGNFLKEVKSMLQL